MKKLSLEMLRLSTNEILERSQMKKITGGYGTGGSGCSNNSCGGPQMILCCSPHDMCSGPTGNCVKRPIGF